MNEKKGPNKRANKLFIEFMRGLVRLERRRSSSAKKYSPYVSFTFHILHQLHTSYLSPSLILAESYKALLNRLLFIPD